MRKVSARLAFWILNRFGAGDTRDFIMGDLLEQHQAGRSAMWLWFQVCGAIAAITLGEVRAHWFLASRAWLTAASTYALVTYVPMALFGPLQFSPSGFLVFVFVRNFAAGWFTGRTHRGLGNAIVLWTAALILFWNVPELARLIGGSVSHARYVPYLLTAAVHAGIACVAAAMGAVTGSSRMESSRLGDV